jgi:hypothetical protein
VPASAQYKAPVPCRGFVSRARDSQDWCQFTPATQPYATDKRGMPPAARARFPSACDALTSFSMCHCDMTPLSRRESPIVERHCENRTIAD